MSEGLVAARERLRRARLYLVAEAAAEPVLGPALRGGVDMVQLRDKDADDEAILRAAARFRALCDEHGALFWLNDRPDLAREAGADGVHVGQDDMPVAEVREQLGPGVLIGLSTHSPEQFDAALHSGADQLSVGPVWETPTKAGRPAAGLDYVRHAAARGGEVPWFAIGGIDGGNLGEVIAAGARRIVVVRAIRDAEDPEREAAALRAALAAAC
ncbi:MAG: thiamine-phosphate pyrophosphorylase [Thermoleophilaceae bacterium]|nr:thiamine-phosphate pyrophosphorylase [Thermoleophilaceae bacterium]